MERLCPICKREMALVYNDKQDFDDYEDYVCTSQSATHHFTERVIKNERVRFKVRASLTNRRLYCQVFSNEGYSEIWEGLDSPNRIRINQIIELNFNSLESIENKIKTYMVFS